jgi:LemA protein
MKMSRVIFTAVLIAVFFAGCLSAVHKSPLDADVKASMSDVLDQYHRRTVVTLSLIDVVERDAERDSTIASAVLQTRIHVKEIMAIQVTPGVISDPVAFERFAVSQRQLTDDLSHLLIVSESNRRLRSDARFHALQERLKMSALRITAARERYDGVAGRYNERIRQFPQIIAARVFGYTPSALFMASDRPSHRVRPRDDFGALRGSLRV